MTSGASSEDGKVGERGPKEIAEGVGSMSGPQLDELIGLLKDARKAKPAPLEAGAAVVPDDPKAPSAGAGSAGAAKGVLGGLAENLANVPTGALSIAVERDFWKSILANLVPWGFALLLAPIVVPWTFERDRAAAQPKISVEYAFLSPHSQAIPDDVTRAVAGWLRQPIYLAYRQSRLMKGPGHDVAAFIMSGARLGPKLYEDLKKETAIFRDYLKAMEENVADQRSKLQEVTDQELQSFAFDVLDDPSMLDQSDPRGFVSRAIDEKAAAVSGLQQDLERLEKVIKESAPEVRVRLTLLNRGATAGLVRHHGEIGYRGNTYPIVRTAPPSADANLMAVPVFQTNAGADDYSAGSVGKIEQDSMVEFWYAFRPTESNDGQPSDGICKPGETVDVTLYDQNRSAVMGSVECNQE